MKISTDGSDRLALIDIKNFVTQFFSCPICPQTGVYMGTKCNIQDEDAKMQLVL